MQRIMITEGDETVSEVIIGLSIVAVGTSLPELAASVMSAWKGEMDISVGNVIGSNIFNVLFVLGICPMVRSLDIEARVLRLDPVAAIDYVQFLRVKTGGTGSTIKIQKSANLTIR